MNFSVTTPHFQYKRLDNGIYEFVLLTNTKAAADDFFDVMARFHQAVADGQVTETQTAFLIELREAGMPPVAYMSNRYRVDEAHYTHKLPPARVAYVYTSGFVFSMVNAFLSLAAKRYVFQQQFFPISERARAEEWLLQKLNLPPAP